MVPKKSEPKITTAAWLAALQSARKDPTDAMTAAEMGEILHLSNSAVIRHIKKAVSRGDIELQVTRKNIPTIAGVSVPVPAYIITALKN